MRQAILDEMKRQGVSQMELSRRTGIAQPHISAWLGKSHRMGANEDTIDKVAKALGREWTLTPPPKRSKK